MTETTNWAVQEQKNYRHMVGDIGWFGLALPAVISFLSVFAIKLGATALQLGLIASLPSLVMLASTFVTEWWSNRYDSPLKAIFWPALLMRVRILMLACVPLLPAGWRIPTLIIILTLGALPMGLSQVEFLVLLRQVVTDRQLTSLFSRRTMVMNLCIAGSTLVLGIWLEKVAFPINYQIMYVLAFIFSMLSFRQVLQVRLLPELAEAAADQPHPKANLLQNLLEPWKEHDFRMLALAMCMVFIGYFSLIPIIPLRIVNELGASEGFYSIYSFLELIGAAGMAIFASRLVNRWGHRNIILIASGFTCTAAVILSIAPNLPSTLPAAFLAGGAWATTDISQFSFFSHTIKRSRTTTYSNAYFQAISLAIFIGPMVGSTLANNGVGLSTVLLIGAGLRITSGILMHRYRVSQPTE